VNKTSELLIGGHVSAAGGFYKAVERATAIHATAMQIFGASPRSFQAPLPKPEDIEKYQAALKASPIRAVYLHALYLVNLATADESLFAKSEKSLADHLRIAEALGADGLVFHPGSAKGLTRVEALERQAVALKRILKVVPGQTKLLVENTAGGGDKLGGPLEDLEFLVKKISSPRFGVCLDTAHAFEFGLVKEYSVSECEKLVADLDKKIGLEKLAVIHANDSKTPSSSNSDRHENIGRGEIDLAGFKNLAKVPELRTKPWLLEVPGLDGEGPDAENIRVLKSCF
jgi:deoxyribonuclease-4